MVTQDTWDLFLALRNWAKQEAPPAVYGVFDRAGRLRRRVGHGGRNLLQSSSVTIAHEKVQYRSLFQGMTRQQVRAEMCRLLVRKCAPFLVAGEI